MTTRRQIKGEQDRRLINVWFGPHISQPNTHFRNEDFIVRDRGSASSEIGFHRLFADFVGWNLPNVPTYEEDETLLYVETLFPLIFIEQKRGWSSLKDRFPTYFKIKDVNRRAFEFILDLNAQEVATQKLLLRQRISEIKQNWEASIRECDRIAESVNGITEGIPVKPTTIWPPSSQPKILISKGNDEWLTIGEEIENLENRFQTINMEEIPTVSAISDSVRVDLENKEEQLLSIDAELREQYQNLSEKRASTDSIRTRIIALEEDLQKNQDVKRLSNLRSVRELHVSTGECPTCHQAVSESLVEVETAHDLMSIDQNINFIKEQLKIFKSMLQNGLQDIEIKSRQVNALKVLTSQIREEIRDLKTTLTSSNNAPSYAAVAEKFRLDEKIRNLKIIPGKLDEFLAIFSHLSEELYEAEVELKRLPKGILSASDVSKIDFFQESFREQLLEYGFDSLNTSEIREIKISENSYTPEYRGIDLRFDLSASDYIRMFWAYFLGLLEVSRRYDTNHLGLLIVDEPRQQSARESSFNSFLRRASVSAQYDQQVIVSTSESIDVLRQGLDSIQHQYIGFPGKILSRI